ncbi:MAG: NAD(P)H-dependent oxidoreductase [Vicinamibacterales bacterium]
MATVVLSGASASHASLQHLLAELSRQLHRLDGSDVRVFDLATTPLAYCQGEFDCWLKTPGACRAHDAEDAIVRAIHDADRLVLLDEATFGGYSYTVKRAVDRMICLISPFFEKRMELTHHEPRYVHAASLHAIGWQASADPAVDATWCALADANALNLMAPRVGAGVLDDSNRETWPQAIGDILASSQVPGHAIVDRASLRDAMLGAAGASQVAPAAPPQTAALLVGSAKARGTSLSENLAGAIRLRLERSGVQVQTRFAVDFLHDARATATAHEMADADLLVLVSPLYVDALPALATRALSLIAEARRGRPPSGRCAALINCGFPEPEHVRTALRIVRHFSGAAGYGWSGGLPLGGGGVMNPQTPVDEQHGPADHIRAALDRAVADLASGGAVSREAIEEMARPAMHDMLYRLGGDLGWRYRAHQNGLTQAQLRARPLD